MLLLLLFVSSDFLARLFPPPSSRWIGHKHIRPSKLGVTFEKESWALVVNKTDEAPRKPLLFDLSAAPSFRAAISSQSGPGEDCLIVRVKKRESSLLFQLVHHPARLRGERTDMETSQAIILLGGRKVPCHEQREKQFEKRHPSHQEVYVTARARVSGIAKTKTHVVPTHWQRWILVSILCSAIRDD